MIRNRLTCCPLTDLVPETDPIRAYFDNSQLTEASMRRIMAYITQLSVISTIR